MAPPLCNHGNCNKQGIPKTTVVTTFIKPTNPENKQMIKAIKAISPEKLQHGVASWKKKTACYCVFHWKVHGQKNITRQINKCQRAEQDQAKVKALQKQIQDMRRQKQKLQAQESKLQKKISAAEKQRDRLM
jgi:septal ring factor EnvC (AmiA/AmiB activator)